MHPNYVMQLREHRAYNKETKDRDGSKGYEALGEMLFYHWVDSLELQEGHNEDIDEQDIYDALEMME